MNDTTMKPKPAKAAAPVIPMFEVPKFEMPKFDMPKMEVPAAFREFAEKGIAQTKDAYEKMKATAEQNTEMLETVYTTASKGSTEYGLKVIEIERANTNAAFDFSEPVRREVAFRAGRDSRPRMRARSSRRSPARPRSSTTLAQKVATETAEPIKTSVATAMKKVA